MATAAATLVLPLLFAACAIAPTVRSPVSPVPGDQRPLRLESTRIAADGRMAEVLVVAPVGIFAVDLDLSGPGLDRFEQLVLVVAGGKACEGLEARMDATAAHPAATIDLLRHAGVAIVPRVDGLAITLDAKALADLRPRARLQFVDRWR